MLFRSGRKPGSGTVCTLCCWHNCALPTGLTGRAALSIPLPFVPWAPVKNRTESHRPRSSRLQAPSHHRSPGHPARGHPDRGQSQRRNPVAAVGGGHSSHPWFAGTTVKQTQNHSGRPWVRPRQISSPASCARNPYPDCTAQYAARERPGQNPLGR